MVLLAGGTRHGSRELPAGVGLSVDAARAAVVAVRIRPGRSGRLAVRPGARVASPAGDGVDSPGAQEGLVASDRSDRDDRSVRAGSTALTDGWATAATPAASLKELGRIVQACTACDLADSRVKPVLGVGPGDARLLLVAATPRRHEDLQGVPVAGACRNVLDHALAAADLSPDEVRITSVVRCRPEDDRTPALDEIVACGAHLRAEIALVAPEVIVSLGAFATAIVLGRPVPIERVAGYRLDVLQGTTLVPTYHPNDAVRGVPQAAPSLRRDLQVAKAVLDGRLTTGAQALAELRSRQAAGS